MSDDSSPLTPAAPVQRWRRVVPAHAALIGTASELPRLLADRLRVRVGLEFQVTTIRHGAGIATDVLSLTSDRHFWDLFSFNVAVRVELVSPL